MTKSMNPLYRTLKCFGVLGYSKRKNIFGMNPFFISTSFILLTEILAALVRKFVEEVFKDNFFKQLVFELIATAELCAACFELIIVADNYGVVMYALFLFLLTVWWSRTWGNASACPYCPMEELVEGSGVVYKTLLTILFQVLGGLVIFQYVQYLWSLELTETHVGKAEEDCTADLNVPMVIGAFVEGIATCLCRLTSRALNDAKVKNAQLLDAFFSTLMVVAAFNFSGGYFNPALATSLKLGCEGNSHMEHFVVYWLGASLGAVISVLIYRTPAVQKTIEQAAKKNNPETIADKIEKVE